MNVAYYIFSDMLSRDQETVPLYRVQAQAISKGKPRLQGGVRYFEWEAIQCLKNKKKH